MRGKKRSILTLYSKVVKYSKEDQPVFFLNLDQNVHFGNDIQKVMMSSLVLQFNVLQGLLLKNLKTLK